MEDHPMWGTYLNSAYQSRAVRNLPEPYRTEKAIERAESDCRCWDISNKRVNKRFAKNKTSRSNEWTNFIHETGKAS